MPNPKSPPAGKGDKPDEADVEILELPGGDRKREKSPEIERGDVKRLCAMLETQLPSVLEKLHEGYKLTAESLEAVKERTTLDKQMQKDLWLVRTGPFPWKWTYQPEVFPEYHAGKPEESRKTGVAGTGAQEWGKYQPQVH